MAKANMCAETHFYTSASVTNSLSQVNRDTPPRSPSLLLFVLLCYAAAGLGFAERLPVQGASECQCARLCQTMQSVEWSYPTEA